MSAFPQPELLLHASCAVRDSIGVLIRGPSGSGKSNLLLRLFAHGFDLVADDRVVLADGVARAPDRLQGMIEVRGLGIFQRGFCGAAQIGLVVEAGTPGGRIAPPKVCPQLNRPLVTLDLLAAASPDAVSLAVACLSGHVRQVSGPFSGEA